MFFDQFEHLYFLFKCMHHLSLKHFLTWSTNNVFETDWLNTLAKLEKSPNICAESAFRENTRLYCPLTEYNEEYFWTIYSSCTYLIDKLPASIFR
jgi:hypothetical protein